jgi:hypothetical protein
MGIGPIARRGRRRVRYSIDENDSNDENNNTHVRLINIYYIQRHKIILILEITQ